MAPHFVIEHRPSMKLGWEFSCPGLDGLCGGGHDYDESVENAEHAVRVHLSLRSGGPVDLRAVRRRIEHHRPPWIDLAVPAAHPQRALPGR